MKLHYENELKRAMLDRKDFADRIIHMNNSGFELSEINHVILASVSVFPGVAHEDLIMATAVHCSSDLKDDMVELFERCIASKKDRDQVEAARDIDQDQLIV